jgi:hypothetical protein
VLVDIVSYMRDLWEHNISHYWYAAGSVGVAAVFAWVYRDVYLPSGLPSRLDRALWVGAALLYGVLIGSVAVQFPSGALVALIFLVVYGFGIVGSALWRRGEVWSLIRHNILLDAHHLDIELNCFVLYGSLFYFLAFGKFFASLLVLKFVFSHQVMTWGTRFVLQYFMMAYLLAFAIVIAWIGLTRSVFINRSQANIF